MTAPIDDYIASATYSPDDNKLRLYPFSRLDTETFKRVKDAGYAWAPKQECFYGVWTPGREDLAAELGGEIEDDVPASNSLDEHHELLIGHVGLHRVTDPAAGQAIGSDISSARILPVNPVVGERTEMPSADPNLGGSTSAVMAVLGSQRYELITGKSELQSATPSALSVNSEDLRSSRVAERSLACSVTLPSPDVPSADSKLSAQQMIAPLDDGGTAALTPAFPLGSGAAPAGSLADHDHQSEATTRDVVQSVVHSPRLPQRIVAGTFSDSGTQVNTVLLVMDAPPRPDRQVGKQLSMNDALEGQGALI